ncbi:hypothetical protein EVAR_91307_1 [Eumeta japonica]|uniref:Uncharacterized protein n=1 Tax=Eumeta variegata TaxID=151549 RepID=A0A4C1SRE1_EUMVA|nr:hypothetical protein EVAR_91307_1 [Eumeta japonica]
MGYAIYEVVGNTERSLLFEEKIAMLWQMGKYRNSTQQGLPNAVKIYNYLTKLKNHWNRGKEVFALCWEICVVATPSFALFHSYEALNICREYAIKTRLIGGTGMMNSSCSSFC